MKKFFVTTLAALCAAGLSTSAFAGTDTASFSVSLVVAPICYIDAVSDVDFGTIGTDGTFITADTGTETFTIDLRCSNSSAYTVALDGGVSPFGGTRNLRDTGLGAETIPYSITKPGGGEWGDDGAIGTTFSGTGLGTTVADTITLTGSAVLGGAAPYVPETYADTVGVTVTF